MQLIPKTAISDITAELEFDMPDLDQAALPHYIVRAARRMCQVGKMMRRKIEVHTYDCVENYELVPPDCVDLVACVQVKNICGMCCGEIVRLIGSASKCFCCGTRSWMSALNIINFFPARHGWIFEVTMAVAPLVDACELDKEFTDKYFDTLMLGTRAYLYDVRDKPWSNAARAQDLRNRFEVSLRAAAADSFMENQAGVLFGPARRII